MNKTGPKPVRREEAQTRDEAIQATGTAQLVSDSQTQNYDQRVNLLQRQASSGEEHGRASKILDDPPAPIVPTLVLSSSQISRDKSLPRSNEPELPPTPVQLGIDARPERPRGLSSSSPRSFKGGSGRSRRRFARDRPITSSPLTPTQQRQALPEVHDQEFEAEMQERDVDTQHENLPEGLKEQKRQLAELEQMLKQAQQHSTRLEVALNTSHVEHSVLEDPAVITHLHCEASQDTFAVSPTNLPYKGLFAPGDVQLATEVSAKVVEGVPKLVHHVTVAAPPPWPRHIFCASFEVTTDVESKRVENVLWTDTLPGHAQAVAIPNELHDWVCTRLESQLHGHDTGGLIWGIGSYFEKAVDRARAFKSLAGKYGALEEATEGLDAEFVDAREHGGDELTEEQIYTLIKYMSKSQLTFELAGQDEETSVRTRRGTKVAPKIMAVWNLKLTWTGDVKTTIQVIPSGIADTATNSVSDLFDRLLVSDGFEKAFDAVYKMMKGVRAESPVTITTVGTGKGKKRKRFS